jgi:hypothetical protein
MNAQKVKEVQIEYTRTLTPLKDQAYKNHGH